MPQLRQNIITSEWVVIAPERAARPSDFVTEDTIKTQSKEKCPFCLGKEAYESRLKDLETKYIYVIPNKFPAFSPSGSEFETQTYHVESNFFHARNSIGGHEVINIKEHDLDLPKFPQEVMVDLFEIIKNRYQYYGKSEENEYAMAIYNHGAAAAASIEHPHAQLFVSSIVPNYVRREMQGSEKYYFNNKACIFCKLIEHEKQQGLRIIEENEDFVAFTFYAARFPFETWILPKAHESQFENIDSAKIQSLAQILRAVLGQLDKCLNDPPFNFFIHSLPYTVKDATYYHWHLEITPRVSKFGGYELGSGVIIDVVSPEKAAEYLRGGKES